MGLGEAAGWSWVIDWVTTSTILDSLHDFGNRSAWGRFVDTVRTPIVDFARGMGLDRSDADDVAQETLLAFAGRYRGGAYDRSKGRLSKWLFGIAYRQVLNARRRLARREAQFPHDAGSMSAFPDRCSVIRLWDQQWGDAILQKCLDRIRWEVEPTTLQAFERVVRDQRTPIDTAKELGISVKSVYNAKHRILKRIRELRSLDLSPQE